MNHTPGPWYYDSNVCAVRTTHRLPETATKFAGEFHGADLHELSCICTVTHLRTWDYWLAGKDYKIEQEVKDRLYKREKANARLIAAAPELLEALKEAFQWGLHDERVGKEEIEAQMEAAIAKATGGAE